MSINLVEEELGVFKASASRMRWFISTAVLVSVLIILHIYLERFSFQAAQLKGVQADWVLTHRLALRECYVKVLDTMKKEPLASEEDSTDHFHNILRQTGECRENMISENKFITLSNLSWSDFLVDYSARDYVFKMAENTLQKVELPVRNIPLLGIPIPANDYVIVMAVMSMVLVIGVWLSLRAIETSLRSLARHKRNDIMEIAQLNTVFLTISEFGDSMFATMIRTSSLWLPFVSIVLATFLGYAPVFFGWLQGADGYAGDKSVVLSFFYISIFVSCVHFWIAWQCDRAMSRIDAIFRTKFDDSLNGALQKSEPKDN